MAELYSTLLLMPEKVSPRSSPQYTPPNLISFLWMFSLKLRGEKQPPRKSLGFNLLDHFAATLLPRENFQFNPSKWG